MDSKQIGKKLDGRYEITELIGVGGMADVYKATDIIENKIVAVKILKKEFSENEEFLRRFRNESKAIALLSHPNIVKVYDVGFSEKIQYIVMEYIDGITLKEYIENERVLTWKDSVHFIIQVLRALQHAHDRGIVHRDIKPQNIMLFTDGTIKVMDFGIAKFAREEGTTATDTAIGTVHYISPEQARGDVTDEKSDIYSVGVMLYEMLTGQKPFDTDNPVTVAVMHMQNIPERPRAINPDIPAGLEEIILRAMEKDCENRYQTASDMIRDLEAFKTNTQMVFGYYVEETPEDSPTQYFQAAAGAEEEYDDDDEYEYEDDDEYYDDDDEDDDDDDDEGESRSLFVPVMTAVTIAFIVVAVFFVLWLIKGVLNGDTHTTKYEMPNLVGMNYKEAKEAYIYLDIQINETAYTTYEKDVIFEQDIPMDEPVVSGQTVYVNVSLGASMVEVPKTTNINYEYAKKMLKQAGLEVELRYDESPEGIEKDCVIRTEPSEGQQAEVGSTVTVYVSKGLATESIKIPDLRGKTIADATTLCEYYGLEVETQDAPSLEEENTVIEQSLAPGSTAQTKDVIVLTYSNGQDPAGTVQFKISNLPTDLKGRYMLDFVGSDGQTIGAASGLIIGGITTTVNIKVEGVGKDTVTVFLTNQTDYRSAELGVYTFDYANNTFTPLREDILGAFRSVETIVETQPPTEPPTMPPAPTEPPYVPPTDPPHVEPEPTDPPYVEPEPTDPPDEGDLDGGEEY